MNARCSSPPEQEPICLQCGDRGYTNSFVYCVKCLQFAVHRYCLDVIPQTVDEFVPWLCDDCDVKTRDHSSTSKHVQGDSAAKNKGKCTINLEATSSSHDEETRSTSSKTDRFGDDMARWIEAVVALEDSSRKTNLSKGVDVATSNSAMILNVIVSLESQLMECKNMLCRAENEVKRVTEENAKLKKAVNKPSLGNVAKYGATRVGPSKRGYRSRGPSRGGAR